MYIILGATGHIGSELVRILLERGEAPKVVVRNHDTAQRFRERGANAAVADIHDTAALHEAFADGTRLFLLNPPADPSLDPDVEERVTARSILTALERSPIERIVAISAYGATQGERIGDLGTLFDLEQGLAAQAIPFSVLRSAYYMTNWDTALAGAREHGVLPSFFPIDFRLAMVAPRDIAEVAAELLTAPEVGPALVHVEGPERYTAAQVAAAFRSALGKPVNAIETPPERWQPTLTKLGFSPAAAESFAGMTQLALRVRVPEPSETRHGSTSLDRYVADLVSG